MRSKTADGLTVIWDVGRPNIFTSADQLWWKEFQLLVMNSPIRIGTNGAFDFISEMVFAPEFQGYGGGGMKYCFAFESEADKAEFQLQVNGIPSIKNAEI